MAGACPWSPSIQMCVMHAQSVPMLYSRNLLILATPLFDTASDMLNIQTQLLWINNVFHI